MNEKVIGEKKPINKKQIGIIAAIVLAIIVIIVVLVLVLKGKDEVADNTSNKNEGPVANTNAEVVKDFEVKGLKFDNISLITDGDMSYLTIDVSNPTSETIKLNSIDIKFKDKDDNEIVTLLGYFGGEVPAGETRTINAQTSLDLTGAVKKEVSISKTK
jgi:hypothetical protein